MRLNKNKKEISIFWYCYFTNRVRFFELEVKVGGDAVAGPAEQHGAR
jgi:hypothetical protein